MSPASADRSWDSGWGSPVADALAERAHDAEDQLGWAHQCIDDYLRRFTDVRGVVDRWQQEAARLDGDATTSPWFRVRLMADSEARTLRHCATELADLIRGWRPAGS